MQIPDVPRIGVLRQGYSTAGSEVLAQSKQMMANQYGQRAAMVRQLGQGLDELTSTLLKGLTTAGASNQFYNAQKEVQKQFQDWKRNLDQMEIREMVTTDPGGNPIYGEPNYEKYIEAFDKFESEVYEQRRKALQYGQAQQSFDRWYAAYMPARREEVIGFRIQKEMNQIEGDFNDRVDHYFERRDLESLHRDTSEMVSRGFIAPNAAEQFLDAQTQRFNHAKAMDILKKGDYVEGMRSLQAGDFAKLLPTDEDVATVANKFTDWYGMGKAAEAEAFEEKNQVDFRNLWDGIKDGKQIDRDLLRDPDLFALTDSQVMLLDEMQDAKIAEGLQYEQDQKDLQMKATLGEMHVKIGNRALAPEDVELFQAMYPSEETAIRYLTQAYAAQRFGGEEATWDARMGQLWMHSALTQQAINDTAEHPNPNIRATTDYWVGKLKQQEAAKSSARQKAEPLFEKDLLTMLLDPNISTREVMTWMENNRLDENGQMKLTFDKFEEWYFGIEKWRENPTWFKGLQAGLDAEYNTAIKKQGTAEGKRALAEEGVQVQLELQDMLDIGASERDIRSYEKNLRDEVIQRGKDMTTRWWILPDKAPEKQMAQWAEAGRLDRWGRLIGVPFEQQLELLGIESFDEFNWSAKQRQSARVRGADVYPEEIATAPVAWWETNIIPVRDENGMPVMATSPGQPTLYLVMRNGEQVWVTDSGEVIATGE